MAIQIQRNPRDPGPHLPKSGGTPFMGFYRDIYDLLSLDVNWIGHLRQKSSGCSNVLDATDTQRSDHMEHVYVWNSAIPPRLGSSTSSIHHHVISSQPGPESTPTSSSPILTPPKPSTSGRTLWVKTYARPSTTRPKSVQWSDEDDNSRRMRQPEIRPISQDQLIAEVKVIYAGLLMVETKCIEVYNIQSSVTNAVTSSKLSSEQWQALVALHRTLLHEHHDFFLASRHPSASPALRRLASKHAMPARMWRHEIHSFLELLRHRRPSSLEHMLTFIYLAYSMMALLYETVPLFEDTRIECLGDLGRYRMVIEDDDMRNDGIRDREVWVGIYRQWYSKASEKSPTTGRLYHHLAICARPNALQQLYYYTRALSVPIPLSSARESIMSLFNPIISNSPTRLVPIDAAFVRAHGILFSSNKSEALDSSILSPTETLDEKIKKATRKWLDDTDACFLPCCYPLILDGWDQALRHFPEGSAMRGLLYCKDYFARNWFGPDEECHSDFDPLVLVPNSPPLSRHIDWLEFKTIPAAL